MLLAITLAAALQAAPAANGVTRTIVATTPTLEAARVEFQPGAADPSENHGYDVVLVPLGDGMTAEVDGVPIQWSRGVPILVSRGAPHAFENHSKHAVAFVEVRTIGDAEASGNDYLAATRATIARSTFDKYVRSTVWRVSGRGSVEWPPDTDQILIVNSTPGATTGSLDVSVVAEHEVRNSGYDEEEVVRVSRKASR